MQNNFPFRFPVSFLPVENTTSCHIYSLLFCSHSSFSLSAAPTLIYYLPPGFLWKSWKISPRRTAQWLNFAKLSLRNVRWCKVVWNTFVHLLERANSNLIPSFSGERHWGVYAASRGLSCLLMCLYAATKKQCVPELKALYVVRQRPTDHGEVPRVDVILIVWLPAQNHPVGAGQTKYLAMHVLVFTWHPGWATQTEETTVTAW